MRNASRVAPLVVLVLALLTSCIPYWRETYYAPDAPGGVRARGTCNPSDPENILRFSFGESRVSVSAGPYDAGTMFSMVFRLDAGHQASLSQLSLNIQTPGDPLRMIPISRAERTLRSPYRPISPSDVMNGEFEPNPVRNRPGYTTAFRFSAQMNERPEQVTVTFPEFVLDGQRFELPPVTFTRAVKHEFLVPINC